jgi:uncharacterized protein YjbJ (UPF0337 family)
MPALDNARPSSVSVYTGCHSQLTAPHHTLPVNMRKIKKLAHVRFQIKPVEHTQAPNVAGARPEPSLTFRTFSEANTRRITMDWNRVEGNWKQTKGKIKEKWGQLTEDDLTQINGKRDQLEGKIQERYGLAKDRARKDIDEWLSTVQ